MKNLTLTFLVFISLTLSQKILAQNVAINSTGSNPDTSAMLDVSSTALGFLMPRLTTAQQNAIILPAKGLTIFNTTLNSMMLNTGTPLIPNWSSLNTSATGGWTLTGNSGINPVINFLGTTDNKSLRFRTNNTQRMKIDSATGNIAIGQDVFDALNPEKVVINAGTTTSVNALVAKGSIDSYLQFNIKNQSAGNNATTDIVATADNGNETTNFVDLGINGSNYTGSAIQTGIANDGYLISTANDFYMVNASANKSMLFLTGGTGVANERMRILANGRVGMGVQNPTAPFVVKDTMEIRRVGSLSQLLFTNTAGSGDFRIGGDGGDIFWQGGGGRGLQMGSYWTTILTGDRQTIVYPAFSNTPNGTGVLVLGSRDASVPLAIQANSVSQTANLTNWKNSSGTILSSMDKSGNLGLGNSAPSQKLDVTGNVRFSGALMPNNLAGTAGNFLTSNGAGTAPTWTVFDTTSISNFSQKVRSLLSATAPITYSNGLIGITQATTSTDGYLSSTDWNTFNNKASTTNSWSTIGNAGTTAATNFIGTTDANGFRIKGNSIQGLLVDSLGNVAVGKTPAFTALPAREKFLVDAGTTTSINAISAKGSIDNYLQLNIQNQSAGVSASSDIVATANNGTETTNFIDMGINGSGNTSNILGVSNDAYLYNQGQNFFIANSTAAKSLIFLTGGTDSATNERMRISGTGNIGIGNAAPSQKLDVTGNLKLTGAFMPGNNAGNAGEFLTSSGAGLSPTWYNANTYVGTVAWLRAGNAGTTSTTDFIGTTDLKSFKIKTNNNQGFLLDSLGNVAVGKTPVFTALPAREKFLVDAGTTTSINAISAKGSIDNYLQLNIQNQSAGVSASSDIVATSNNGTETTNFIDMGINGSGNTSNILGNSNDAYLYNQGQNFFIANSTSAKSLIFLTGGTDSATNERMRISGTGDVGISTIPVSTLDVGGSVGTAITTTTVNITLDATNYTVILTGGTPGVTLPAPAANNARRIYVIVNESGAIRGTSNYKALSGAPANTINNATSITIQSDGTTWYQIR